MEQEQANVEEELRKLETQIAAAREQWTQALDASTKEFWNQEVSSLRSEFQTWLGMKATLLQKRYAEPQAGGQSRPSVQGGRTQLLRDVKKITSPSSWANNGDGGWCDPQLRKVLAAVRTHRPAELPSLGVGQQLPVGLLSPILAQVEEDCAYAEPTAADTDFAVKLSLAMSESFSSEDLRRDKFCQMVGKEFVIPLKRTLVRDASTDGSAIIPVGSTTALAVNLVAKNEIGSGGGEPRLQNAACASLHAAMNLEELSRCSRCPTLLLELAGPNLSLSGFAIGEAFFCDQLSQMVSLLWQPKSEIAIGAPRVIYAIRKAWPALQEFYAKPMEVVTTDQLQYPYQNFYHELESTEKPTVRYVERVSTFTFKAESVAGSKKKLVLIKFCRRYSFHAHKELADAGYAPCLLGFEELPGRWLMVVMDYLENAAHWSDAMSKPVDALTAAVQTLHEAEYVHGDLRSPNVLVVQEKVYLVDFEWAGKLGDIKYPLFMNRDSVRWPDGATDGQPILKEHDLEWIARLVAEAG